ncbi:MAG: tyrosine-type recombinase/integrase [Candidatus Aenigmarchaeota archaeon]|nr:tyrosine-type recombinase/integrase [Candidatus Aenigmarchaeota archaeon]
MSGLTSEYIIMKKLFDEIKMRGASKKYKKYIEIIKKYLESGKSIREFISEASNKKVTYLVLKFFTENILEMPTEDISVFEEKYKIPVILSKSEIERMINLTNNKTHYAILCALYFAGLRLQEARFLKWSEIDFENDLITINGRNQRVLFLHPKLKEALSKLNRISNYVFVSCEGKIYDERTIQQIVSRAARRARVHKRVSPYTLRHTFAVHLLENGADIRYVKYLLGHKDIRSTQIYEYIANKNIKSLAKLI